MILSRQVLAATGILLTGVSPAGAQSSTGRILQALSDGDYVLPRFSPNGQFLAVSQVLTDSASENTQILLLDLRRGHVDTLLPASAAAKYGVFKTYVSSFEWLSDSTLRAWVSDGDVGATAITFDVRSRSILHEVGTQGDEDTIPTYQSLADSLALLYPSVGGLRAAPADVFGSGLSSGTLHGQGFVILQKRYAGIDGDIWMYRLDQAKATRIMPLPGGANATLAGGFIAGRDIIFAAGADTLRLYRLRAGTLSTLMVIPVRPQQSHVSVRAQRGDSTWFVLTLRPSYERGNNPALLYDGEHLRRLGHSPEIVDMDVNIGSQRIAYAYWEGSQRHVLVQELTIK